MVVPHDRQFRPKSPRNLYLQRLPGPRRGVASSFEPLGASDSSFSFVFFIFQLLTFNFQPSFPSNSFPHNSLSDSHPLNPVASIFYKNSGGSGVPSSVFIFVIPSVARDLLFPHFIISLCRYFNTRKLSTISPTSTTSAPKAIAVIC